MRYKVFAAQVSTQAANTKVACLNLAFASVL